MKGVGGNNLCISAAIRYSRSTDAQIISSIILRILHPLTFVIELG